MSTRFDPTDPDYRYPHAEGTVPDAAAATITDTAGGSWRLTTARAVPTGHYLWWLVDTPSTFRTLPQINSQRGLTDVEAAVARTSETKQFNRGHDDADLPRVRHRGL